MKDSKGNEFNAGDILLSINHIIGPKIICISITEAFTEAFSSIAYFRVNRPIELDGASFCLTQKSLNLSKWVKKGSR